MTSIKRIILITILFVALDHIWFKVPIAKKIYNNTIKSIQGLEIDSTGKIPFGVIAYLIMGLAYYHFIDPKLNSNWKKLSVVFSLAVWGVFNLTNMVIFKNYTQKMIILDTVWGIVATQIVGHLLKNIDNNALPSIFGIY